jgi:hypothetical protein
VGRIGVRASLDSAAFSLWLEAEGTRVEPDFNTEFTEVGDTEVAEKEGNGSEWEWGIGIGGLRAEPFDRLRADILRRMSSVYQAVTPPPPCFS